MPDPAQWSQLRGLMFTARTLVEGLYAGAHASPRHGPGLEFHDYRAYVPGDDLAAVDWKLFGRTDRYYLRRYQRYTDLHTHLLVDGSASMAFAGFDRRGRPLDPGAPTAKLRFAKELAAAIAFLMVRQSDRVGLSLLDHRQPRRPGQPSRLQTLPPGGTWPHLQRLCADLEAVKPGTPGTTSAVPGSGPGGVGAALRELHAQVRRRGLVVLISDLLDEPADLFDGLNRLRHARCDVLVFQVLTPHELDLGTAGRLRLQMVDSETRAQVATHVPEVAARYRQLLNEHLTAIRRGCAARNVDYHLMRTDQPVVEALRHYLTRRAALQP